jgi:hypothetical protein
MTRRTLVMFLGVLLVVDALVVGTLIGVVHSPVLGLTVGLGALVLPLGLIYGLVPFILRPMGWEALARRYRAPSPVPFPDSTPMTSIAIRSRHMRMNNCVGVLADDDHLHLTVQFPRTPLLPDLSIPWEAVTEIGDQKPLARLTLIDGPAVWVPTEAVARERQVRSIQLPSPIPGASP